MTHRYIKAKQLAFEAVRAAGTTGVRPVDIKKILATALPEEEPQPHRRTVMLWLQTDHRIERSAEHFGFYRLRTPDMAEAGLQ